MPKILILHCSDSPDRGDQYGLKDIDEWHKARGMNSCGYHYVIRRSGVIEIGRPETTIGAHTFGHNDGSLGICLVGKKHFTEMQVDSIMFLFKAIWERHHIESKNIFGHYEFFEGKDCPGVSMSFVRKLLSTVKLG